MRHGVNCPDVLRRVLQRLCASGLRLQKLAVLLKAKAQLPHYITAEFDNFLMEILKKISHALQYSPVISVCALQVLGCSVHEVAVLKYRDIFIAFKELK